MTTHKKHKIAIYHNHRYGGARRVIYEHARELNRRGYQIDEFSLSTATTDFLSLTPYIQSQRVFQYRTLPLISKRIPFLTPYIHAYQTIKNLKNMERVLRKVARAINQGGYDTVFIHDCPFVLIPPIISHVNIPNALYIHSIPFRYERLYWPRRLGNTLPERMKDRFYAPAHIWLSNYIHNMAIEHLDAASLVLTNSHFTKEQLFQKYEVTGYTLYPGVDTARFRPLDLECENYVLSVGKVDWNKGHRLVIEALSRINEAIRPQLIIAKTNNSPTPEEETLKRIALDKNVELIITHIRDDTLLAEFYNRALCVVCGYLVEPFGLTAIEAMACGTPVIAVSEGGLRETVINGVTGFLIDRKSVDFAHAIETLIEEPHLRRELSINAADIAQKNWSWTMVGEKLELILQQLC